MKKVLSFVALVAMLAFVSCQKPANNTKPSGGNNDGSEQQQGGDGQYKAPIAIDGDFSDWAAIDASKLVVAKNSDAATHPALKVMKVYADALYVYVYFEWDDEYIEDKSEVPVHFYINTDGDAATGGFADQFTDACSDLMTEGMIFSEGELISYDPGLFKWEGEVNGSGWDYCWTDLDPVNGFIAGEGAGNKFEVSFMRELNPMGDWADTFSIGMDIQQSWDSVGILPNADGENAASLTVTVNKLTL